MIIYKPIITNINGHNPGTRLKSPIARNTIPAVLLSERTKSRSPNTMKKYSHVKKSIGNKKMS
jgi:hypothetical protein